MLAELIRKLTYFPERDPDLTPARFGLSENSVQTIHCETSDHLTLHGWHFLATGQSATTPADWERELNSCRPLVLMFAGNGGHRGYRISEIGLLTDVGANVFLFDYRGYGDNDGSPSEQTLAADAEQIWRYATQERRVAPDRILLYGESLGGAVAIGLAAGICQRGSAPAGLIVRSTFSALADVAQFHYPLLPVKLLLTEKYASVECIRQVICPILIVHGQRDSIVPWSHSQTLLAAAPQQSQTGIPPQFVTLPRADHNDVLESEGELLAETLEAFVRQVLAHHGNRPSTRSPCP